MDRNFRHLFLFFRRQTFFPSFISVSLVIWSVVLLVWFSVFGYISARSKNNYVNFAFNVVTSMYFAAVVVVAIFAERFVIFSCVVARPISNFHSSFKRSESFSLFVLCWRYFSQFSERFTHIRHATQHMHDAHSNNIANKSKVYLIWE